MKFETEPFDQPAFPGGSVPGVPGLRDWHALDAATVVTELGADLGRGLAASELNKRHLRYGPNALQEIRPRPAWRLLRKYPHRHKPFSAFAEQCPVKTLVFLAARTLLP